MTDARAEMRKNVREIIARGCGCDRPCGDRMSVLDCGCLNYADAAIDSVLEKAARCAEDYEGKGMEIDYIRQSGDASRTRSDIAKAIRALKEKQ